MEKARRELGAEHGETLRCMYTYAVLLQRVGRYEEAGPLSREVLAASSARWGASTLHAGLHQQPGGPADGPGQAG